MLVNKSDHTPLNLRDFPVEIWEELSERGKRPSFEPAPANGEVDIKTPFREPQNQGIRASLITLLDLNGGNLAQALEHCERLLFEAALHKAHGNQTQVARLLGITPHSVYNKIHKYRLQS